MKAFFSITLLVVGVTAAQAGHLAGTGSRIIMFEGILSKVGPMLPPLPDKPEQHATGQLRHSPERKSS
jgi:hypothetical protein